MPAMSDPAPSSALTPELPWRAMPEYRTVLDHIFTTIARHNYPNGTTGALTDLDVLCRAIRAQALHESTKQQVSMWMGIVAAGAAVESDAQALAVIEMLARKALVELGALATPTREAATHLLESYPLSGEAQP